MKSNQRATIDTAGAQHIATRDCPHHGHRSQDGQELPPALAGATAVKFPRGGHRLGTVKFPHPGHRLLGRWPPPCANPGASSSKPNCGSSETPRPSTRTWSTSTALLVGTTRSNASWREAAPQGARAVRSPVLPARRGDAGGLRRGRSHPRARQRPVPQAPPVRGHLAVLPCQLPARGVEVQPADLGRAARAGPGGTSAAARNTWCWTI